MKTLNFLPITCAALIAVATLGAPPSVRAQEQPRPPQSAINADAKIALPAQFDAPQFFDALAKAAGIRIVAPIPNANQLAQLNQKLGGQTLTLQEIVPVYQETLGYNLAPPTAKSNLVSVRLPDELIYPRQAVSENYVAFLRLLAALSSAQIEQMNLQNGLTVQDLTPDQTALYLDARRKNENVAMVLGDDKPLTDAQILAQKVRFRFAFQAVAVFTDDAVFGGLPLFDYSTGLIWNPLVAADTKKLEKYFDEGTMVAGTASPARPAVVDLARAMNTPFNVAQTQTTTIGAMLDQIGRATGQTVAFGEGANAERLRATPVVVSSGAYKTGELTFAVAATAGLEFGFLNGTPTLNPRRPQQPISQLPPLVEGAQQKLRRLSLPASGLPFSEDRFDGKEVKYDYLTGAEKFYLRTKMLNENTDGYDQIDLSKHTFRFANQLLFIGQSGDIDSPFVTSSLQIW